VGFEDAIQAELSRHVLAPGLVAVVVLGLDEYPPAGVAAIRSSPDPVLIEVAGRLTSVIRPIDTVARLDVAEFGVLADLLMTAPAVFRLAERLLDVLKEPYRSAGAQQDDPELSISVSSGVAVTGNPRRSAARLIEEASDARRRAARAGGNRSTFSDPEFRRLLAGDAGPSHGGGYPLLAERPPPQGGPPE